MNLYINKAKENWVVDRFRSEWNDYNFKISNNYLFGKSPIWIIAPWTWKSLNKYYLKRRKVVCTIHHIDEDNFTIDKIKEFNERDKYVNLYHSISNKTTEQLMKYTNKDIITIPFWVNQKIWRELNNKDELRKKYGFSKNDYLVGSFQRDTEGYDLKSPKLSKGPDRFIEIIKKLNFDKKNVKVVLSGKRRNYVISNLEKLNIDYKYFEMTKFDNLNELYNILDLYIVASRYEGGPQSISECALTKTPIISTDVGIASEILSKESIFDMDNFIDAIPNTSHALSNIEKYKIPNGFKKFNDMFNSL